MKTQILYLTAAVVAATAALSAFAAPEPAKVVAGTYAVEPVHTRVMFALDHMGFTTYYGQFSGASGTLKLDPKNLSTMSLDVEVPTANVSTTSGKLDAELKSAGWLDAEKYATVAFKSTGVQSTGANTAKVMGELTLHGATKPVIFEATLHGQGVNPLDMKETVGFDVRGKIKRSDFGIDKYIPLVGDEVDIIISAAFEKRS